MSEQPLKEAAVVAARMFRLGETPWRVCGVSSPGENEPVGVALVIGELGKGAQPLTIIADSPQQVCDLFVGLVDAATHVFGADFTRLATAQPCSDPPAPGTTPLRASRRRRRGGR